MNLDDLILFSQPRTNKFLRKIFKKGKATVMLKLKSRWKSQQRKNQQPLQISQSLLKARIKSEE
jgi:hypothetical protein